MSLLLSVLKFLLCNIICFAFLISCTHAPQLSDQQPANVHIDSLISFSKKHRYIDASQALDSALLAMALSKYTIDSTYRFSSYIQVGLGFNQLGNYEEALLYFDSATQIGRALKETSWVGKSLSNIGMTKNNLGQYEAAISDYFAALKYVDSTETGYVDRANILNNIGLVYKNMGQYDRAIKYYKKTAHLDSLTGSGYISITINNIGEIYRFLANPDSAKYFFNLARSINEKSGNLRELAFNLNNLAILYSTEGDSEKAWSFFQKSLTLKQKVGHRRSVISGYTNIGIVHQKNKDYKPAIQYYDSAILLADSIGYKEGLKEGYYNMFTAYQELKDFKNALAFSRKYEQINDSLINEKMQGRIEELEKKYETEKKEAQIKLLQHDNQLKDANLRYQLIMVLSLGCGITILGIFSTILFKVNKKLAVKNHRIKILIKELKHRTKNNLQILSSLLSIQDQETTEDPARNVLRESKHRLTSIALLHQQLDQNPDDQSSIDFSSFAIQLIEGIASSYGFPSGQFKINNNIVYAGKMSLELAVPLSLIINELASNAFKHGLQDIKRPEITIGFILRNEMFILIFKDNGTGGSVKLQRNGLLGLKIVYALADQLKAVVEHEQSNEGLAWTITLPKSKINTL